MVGDTVDLFSQYQHLRKLQEDELKYGLTKLTIPKDVFERKILGMFNTEDEHELKVGERYNGKGNNYMNNYNEEYDCSVDFLFDNKKWNGNNISSMKSSYIINTILMLERKASMYKTNYEMWIIDNTDNTSMKVPRDKLSDIMATNALDWIISTPIFVALMEEIQNRGLMGFLNIVRERRKDDYNDKQ